MLSMKRLLPSARCGVAVLLGAVGLAAGKLLVGVLQLPGSVRLEKASMYCWEGLQGLLPPPSSSSPHVSPARQHREYYRLGHRDRALPCHPDVRMSTSHAVLGARPRLSYSDA